MRTLKTTILILLLFTVIGKAQFVPHKITVNDSDSVVYDPNKTFKNQGEQEDYWAEELFKQKYKKQKFGKYNGDIKAIDDDHLGYGNTSIRFDNKNLDLKLILTNGILYPAVIDTYTTGIVNFEEITFVNHSEKVKRFRFWLFHKLPFDPPVNVANPTVYFIELTNKSATEKTSREDFIKGSELTFVKQGWVVI